MNQDMQIVASDGGASSSALTHPSPGVPGEGTENFVPNFVPSCLRGSAPLPVPVSKLALNIRVATLDDLTAIDALQKRYHKQLGFFPRAQMEGYLKNGWVLAADAGGELAGYCASRDRYLKRDELGAIFQLCVSDRVQRKFVGATLLREVFARSAYGCKLFCCWCAQDLQANYFWEAMGFVPIAFRAGSDKKRRVHIFWQKRIRQGDETTPWWFPAKTEGGALREDRIVLPIPPGVRWKDVRGFDTGTRGQGDKGKDEVQIPLSPCLPVPLSYLPAPAKREKRKKPEMDERDIRTRGLRFGADAITKPKEPTKREPQPKRKIDPRFASAARELRDRWLEEVNSGRFLPEGNGKYEIARALPEVRARVGLLAA